MISYGKSMSRGSAGVTLTRFLLFISIPVISGLCTLIVFQHYFLSAVDPSNAQRILFEIPRDHTMKQVAAELEQKRFLRVAWPLVYLGRFSGKDNKMVAGEYELAQNMNVAEVLKTITSGKPLERKLVIPEGTTMAEIADLVDAAGIIGKAQFFSALQDKSLVTAAGSGNGSLEGYLFPNTYNFSRPITPQEVLVRLIKEGQKHWPQQYTDRADELGMSRHRVITLASIIEKESGNSSEQPLISSVFHNRLKAKMPLQSDPTVIYGIPDFDGNLTKEHLQRATPFNTYVITGLPPGPICNPGDTAIKAALYPEETEYLFFVANGEGSHVFSKTLAEHNAAVATYQLNKTQPTAVP
jgi:UPF0755 protein